MSFHKHLDHDIMETVFQNNRDFYDDVCGKELDIRLFEKSFKKSGVRCGSIGFIALGRVMSEETIFSLLTEWVPNFRAQFWWFVLHRNFLT